MFKVQKGLENIEWVKPPLLTKKNDLSGPASVARGNSLRIRRESFKYFFKEKKNRLPDYDASGLTKFDFI